MVCKEAFIYIKVTVSACVIASVRYFGLDHIGESGGRVKGSGELVLEHTHGFRSILQKAAMSAVWLVVKDLIGSRHLSRFLSTTILTCVADQR